MWHTKLEDAIKQANDDATLCHWCFSVRLKQGIYGVYCGAYDDAEYTTI